MNVIIINDLYLLLILSLSVLLSPYKYKCIKYNNKQLL